jgi:hypothetical protein
VIPPHLVVGSTVRRADIDRFVLRPIGLYAEGDANEPARIGLLSGPWSAGKIHRNRAVVE